MRWAVLAGDDPDQLQRIGAWPKEGFETGMTVQSDAKYFAVEALGATESRSAARTRFSRRADAPSACVLDAQPRELAVPLLEGLLEPGDLHAQRLGRGHELDERSLTLPEERLHALKQLSRRLLLPTTGTG